MDGKQPQLEKIKKMLKHFWKKDTNKKWRLKMKKRVKENKKLKKEIEIFIKYIRISRII